jgi:endoglucanase
LLFYDAQRSGRLPANNPIPYRGDSALGDKGANNEDLTGGYYDGRLTKMSIYANPVLTLFLTAGDFVKFGFPMAYTITVVAWGVVDWTSGYSAAGTR